MSSSVIAARGDLRDGQAEFGADVVQGFAEGEGLADGDPLGVIGDLLGARPAGVVAGHRHTCLS